MHIRVCALKLWLLLHVTALNLHPCFSIGQYLEEIGIPPGGEYSQRPSDNYGVPDAEGPSWSNAEDNFWTEYYSRKYFYAHNETQIAMARALAEAHHGGGGATSDGTTLLSSILGPATFPDFPPSEDGCSWSSTAQDLSLYGSSVWDASSVDHIQILAVDSCTQNRDVQLGDRLFEFCSQRWVKEKPDILIRDDPSPLTHFLNKVLVRIRIGELDVLADGIYFPTTGKMHLAGCIRGRHPSRFSDSTPPTTQDYVLSAPEMMSASYEAQSSESIPPEYWSRYDPDSHHETPLNSSTPEDCTISATLQYPPLNCRWNSERFLKYSIRSSRAKDDPLYFAPAERSAFFPYLDRYFTAQSEYAIQLQRRLETGGRILLLVLGLVCIALQIRHGRNNEESLPFVSLVMLGIQVANHLSQTSIFKDLQIGEYGFENYTPVGYNDLSFPEYSIKEYNYYAIMAWSEHVPYQAMAMAAIFMYVWIFHKVGDRRRIMKLRVLKRRSGAKDPPSDWRVMYTTLAIFGFVGFLGFFVIGADQDGHFRRALTGKTAAMDRYVDRNSYLAPYSDDYSPFVSSRFYELSQAQWGFVNRLTGLVVSFFLVPQLLGNMEWDLQGRPLSVWFYAGIPFLQSIPHAFTIAKHFQLLPIFPIYDPYINSIYGIFENPTPWWQVGVVLCSTLQVLAVHSQFSRSLRSSRHSSPKLSPVVQTCDNVL